MQDLTLIRDEDALPLQGPDGRLQPGPVGLLDTIEDLGTGMPWAVGRRPELKRPENTLGPYSLFLPMKPGDEPALSLRSSTSQPDPRTETSEDDLGDKAPKRTKPIKKVLKAEVRIQVVAWGDGGSYSGNKLIPIITLYIAIGFQDTEDPAQEEEFWRG